MNNDQTTGHRTWDAIHIPRSDVIDGIVVPTAEKFWTIREIWFDDQGRRNIRFIAEIYEQAGDPLAAAANAKKIVEAINASAN